MKHAFVFSAAFISLVIAATGQEAPKATQATPEELEAARKTGEETALADAKKGKFILPFTQLPKGEPWLLEWLELAPKRGFTKWPFVCLSGASNAQLQYFQVHSEAYDRVMLEQIKLHFSEDIFARLNAEAKALHEAKQSPKPSTPKARRSKSKK